MSNEQKTPLTRTLPLLAQRKALAEIRKSGLSLPGHVTAVSGSIVTVSFDVQNLLLQPVDMPVFGPEYIRYPIQVGDKGVAFPASVYIGGVSGLGTGTATLTQQANLTTLVWFPCGNKNWSTVVGGLVFPVSAVTATENLTVGNGWTGTFVDLNGQVITVQNGIIVNGE